MFSRTAIEPVGDLRLTDGAFLMESNDGRRRLIDKAIVKPSWLDYIPFSSYFRSSLNKNGMQWLIWNLGNFSTLSSKFSDTNTFLLTTKEKLTKLKQNYKIILLYNTDAKPFEQDEYLEGIEQTCIESRVHLLHLPCNVALNISTMTNTDPNLPFKFNENGATVRHGYPSGRYFSKIWTRQ